MKIVAAFFLLALPFGITAAIAAVIAPFAAPFYGVSAWVRNVFRAMDCLGAAVLGFTGRHTVSAECGARPGCVLCGLLCRFLDWVQPGHCAGAAKAEGVDA